MARILAYTVLLPGHLYPFVPIMVELRRRGHDARFVLITAGDKPESIAGVPIRPEQIEPVGIGGRAGSEASTNRPLDTGIYGEPAARNLELVLIAERPELVIVDPMFWGAMIVAEAAGLPWVSLSHNPNTIRGLGLDVRGPGLRPPRGLVERMAYRAVVAVARAKEAAHGQTVNAVRSARGLPSLAHPWDLFYAPRLTIATTVEPFEYPRRDWPASIRFVGPLFWEPQVPDQPWLEKLDERPLVLVAGSSVPGNSRFRAWSTVVLEGLANDQFQVVATLPTEDIPDDIPPNAHIARFLPHAQLLSRAVCVVCHGGPGITQKALAAGVPVVAVPFAYDRYEIAQRVQVACAGVMLPGNRLTVRRVKRAVRKAISCKPGAMRIAEAFRTAGGARAAVDAIEGLLGQYIPVGPSQR